MNVLVTGAAGQVGTELCKELAAHHDVRMLDIRPAKDPPGEFVQGSITEWDTVKAAVEGMDAVAHLAIHNPGEGRNVAYHEYMQSDVDIGVKGTDMLLHAAKDAGLRRFVYASSLNVYSARYPEANEFLTDTEEPLAAEHYGTIKWLAEEMCRHYGLSQGLSTIVVRFNTVTFPDRWVQSGKDRDCPGFACTRVHIEDAVRAVRQALEKEGVEWGRCLISGANPEKRFNTRTAEELIGFKARYGFAAGKMYRDAAEVVV
jgi:nucleoside-diphosphate-sugar epimerase